MNKKCLVLGFHIPRSILFSDFENDKNPAIQTYNFNKSFINLLEGIERFDFGYISNRPVSTFPKNSRLILRTRKHKDNFSNQSIEILESGYVNFPFVKLLTRVFMTLLNCVRYCRSNKTEKIIVYSVHLPYLICSFLVSKLFKLETIALWTDPPAVTRSDNAIVKSVRKLELIISKWLMSKFDKTIVLSKHLAIDFNPNAPYFVLEGISKPTTRVIKNVREMKFKKPISIVYTGSLEERYGLLNLLDAFAMFEEGTVVLDLYGFGSLTKVLSKDKFKNVNFHGRINSSSITRVQQKADFLINCRSPKDLFTKYSFPSKTIEYLSSGTPTIMTFLPGIPKEYREYLLVVKDDSPRSIYERILTLIDDYDECLIIAEKARQFMNDKTPASWSAKLAFFLEK